MQKLLNKFFIINFIICFLSMPVFALEDSATIKVEREISDKGQMELVQNEVSVKDIDIDPLNTGKVKKSVIPDTKQEGKKVIKLFIKTMIAVVMCTIVLYAILLFVKKFYTSAFVYSDDDDDEYENLDLATPKTKQDALKSFLDRVNF